MIRHDIRDMIFSCLMMSHACLNINLFMVCQTQLAADHVPEKKDESVLLPAQGARNMSPTAQKVLQRGVTFGHGQRVRRGFHSPHLSLGGFNGPELEAN